MRDQTPENNIEDKSLLDWLTALTPQQLWGVFGTLGVLVVGAFTLGTQVHQFFVDTSPKCVGVGNWPLGIWNVRSVHYEGHDNIRSIYNISFNDPKHPLTGIWLEGGHQNPDGQYDDTKYSNFTVSDAVKINHEIELTFVSTDYSFISINELFVSPDGCSMKGTVKSTRYGKPFLNGSVDYCWANGPNCETTYFPKH